MSSDNLLKSSPPIFVYPAQLLQKNFSNIWARISVLSQWCGDYKASFFYTCVGEQRMKDVITGKMEEEKRKSASFSPFYLTYIVFYIQDWEESKDIIEVQLAKINQSFYSQISSSFTLRCFSDIWEIWDVCSLPISRGKGNMKSMISYILYSTNISDIWLSVDFRNPLYYLVCKLYLELGFRNPVLTKETPHHEPFPTQFLQLVYKRNSFISENYDNELQTCLSLRLSSMNTITRIPLHMHKSVFEKFFKNAEELDIEVGGSLFKDTTITIRNKDDPFQKKNIINICGLAGTERAGDIQMVSVPIFSLLSYHVHSSHVLKYIEKSHWTFSDQLKAMSATSIPQMWGWPSGPDFKMVYGMASHLLDCYIPSTSSKNKEINFQVSHPTSSQVLGSCLKHYVFAREGAYSIQITPEFQQFIHKLPSMDVKVSLERLIFVQFGLLEWLRFNKKSNTISSFLTFTNSHTMSQLLRKYIFPWTVIFEDSKKDTKKALRYLHEVMEREEKQIEPVRRWMCEHNIDREADFPLFTVRFFSTKEVSEKDGILDTIDVPSEFSPVVLALLERQNLTNRAKYEIEKTKSIFSFLPSHIIGRWEKGDMEIPHHEFIKFPNFISPEMTQEKAEEILESKCKR